MEKKNSDGLPDNVAEVKRQITAWRQTRTKGQRVPEDLWAAAVELARVRGVGTISRLLGVGFNGMRKRTLAKPATHAEGPRDLQTQAQVLERDIDTRNRAFRARVTSISVAAVQRTLGRDEALVEWARYRPRNHQAADAGERRGPERYAACIVLGTSANVMSFVAGRTHLSLADHAACLDAGWRIII